MDHSILHALLSAASSHVPGSATCTRPGKPNEVVLDYFLILVLRLRAYIIANGLDVKWDWSELKKKKDNLARRHLTSLVI